MLLENIDFDEFDLSRYDIRNPEKKTQTDLFNHNNSYSGASSDRSIRTQAEGHDDMTQDSRQVSLSSGESMDNVGYTTRMSIADDLATMARVGGNITYYTGQGIGPGICMAADTYNWFHENEEDDDIQPPIDEKYVKLHRG